LSFADTSMTQIFFCAGYIKIGLAFQEKFE